MCKFSLFLRCCRCCHFQQREKLVFNWLSFKADLIVWSRHTQNQCRVLFMKHYQSKWNQQRFFFQLSNKHLAIWSPLSHSLSLCFSFVNGNVFLSWNLSICKARAEKWNQILGHRSSGANWISMFIQICLINIDSANYLCVISLFIQK